MPEVLTPIEQRIYSYLVDHLKRETYQPSIREIGSRFGIRSTKTVTEHLQSLQRKGYLDRIPSRSRALKILGIDLSPKTYTVPVYDNPAGRTTGPAERFDLDRRLVCSADCFMVRVAGDHMNEAGILDGDYILVEPSAEPKRGEPEVVDRNGVVELRRTGSNDGGGSDGPNAGRRPPTVRRVGAARAVLRVLR